MIYSYTIKRKRISETSSAKVTGANIAARYLLDNCFAPSEMWRESCWALMLNAQNEIVGQFLVSQGTDNACQLDRKSITKVALETMAKGVIVAHNHPSGNVRPSSTDLNETQKLKSALDLFDIPLLDHIIVGENEFYSFSDDKPTKIRKPKPVKVEDIFTPEQVAMMNETMAKAFSTKIL